MKISGWMVAAMFAACIGTAAAQNAGVVQRGESHEGMGFSQTTTTHHFYLTQTGGIIQVTAIAVAAEGVLATALFVLLYEEATLRRKFGVEYEEYCRNVRRRVPRMRAWGP